jgi:hypothetical protein
MICWLIGMLMHALLVLVPFECLLVLLVQILCAAFSDLVPFMLLSSLPFDPGIGRVQHYLQDSTWPGGRARVSLVA